MGEVVRFSDYEPKNEPMPERRAESALVIVLPVIRVDRPEPRRNSR